jgi:hypothetical protein
MMWWPSPHTVRPELVEGQFCLSTVAKTRQGFDRLSPNGALYG